MGQSVHCYKDLQQGRARLPKYVGLKRKCDGCRRRLHHGEPVQIFHRSTRVLCTRAQSGISIFTPSCAVAYGIFMVMRRKSRMIAKRDAIYEGLHSRRARREQS